MADVRIHYLRPPDREDLFVQRLVHESAEVVITLMERTDLARPVRVEGAVVLEAGAPVVWFTFPGAWHDLGRFHRRDGTFTGLYANILEPAVFLAPREWRTVDLFLDLWLPDDAAAATGARAEPQLLDEDELEEALARGWLDAAMGAAARAEAERLLARARVGDWPPEIVRAWPLERARAAAREQDSERPRRGTAVPSEKARSMRVPLAGAAGLGLSVALLLTPGGVRAQAQAQAPAADEGAALVRRAGMSRALGSKDATVTVYEVADFQCPFCAQFANQAFHRIDSAYVKPGKVQWVFVNLPLVMHPNAFQAAEAALCAGAVGDRFWPMHEKLYQSQPEWTGAADPQAVFLRYARALGVPETAYSACIRAERVWPVIMRDAMYATSAQIDGTPTYIIGNQVAAVGAKSFDEWKTILDKAIQDAAAKKKP